MGLPDRVGLQAIFWMLAINLIAGCGREGNRSTSEGINKQPAVISLVPAATDILIGMGSQDHLVGVSNFDLNPATARLPRVGDYLTTDWEKIAQLHPRVIMTQYAPGRTPEGFVQNLQALGAVQLNLHIDRLDEIFVAIERIGVALQEPEKGAGAERRLHEQIDQVRHRVGGLPRVRTVILTDDAARQTCGPGTFLDDILNAAGGENAVPAGSPLYPSIDREQLVALAPQVILQLLPNASSAVLAQAREACSSARNVPAIRNGRFYQLTDWNVELPGYHVGEMAMRFADLLHPPAASRPGLAAGEEKR